MILTCVFSLSVVPHWFWFGEEIPGQPHSAAHTLQRRQELDWHSSLRLHQRTPGDRAEVRPHAPPWPLQEILTPSVIIEQEADLPQTLKTVFFSYCDIVSSGIFFSALYLIPSCFCWTILFEMFCPFKIKTLNKNGNLPHLSYLLKRNISSVSIAS